MSSPISDVTFKPAENEDTSFIEALYQTTQKPLLNALGGWNDVTSMPRFRRLFNRHRSTMIWRHEQRIGWFQLNESKNEITINQIHLIDACRSQGLGTAIIEHIMRRALTTKRSVTLSVVENNPALSLYLRLGFQIIERTNHRVRMRWFHPG